MKNFLLAMSIVLINMHAYAAADKVVSVEFQVCSFNQSLICALVYHEIDARGAVKNYHGEEMGIKTSSEAVTEKIRSSLMDTGRSLARNVLGEVSKVSDMYGHRTHYQLEVTGFEVRGDVPTPRGI